MTLDLHISEKSDYVRARRLGSGDEPAFTYCHACKSDYCHCEPGQAVRGVTEETDDEA